MNKIRRVIFKKKAPPQKLSKVQAFHTVNTFIHALNISEDPEALIEMYYKDVFGQPAPGGTLPVLLKVAVGYELQYRGLVKAGRESELSEAFNRDRKIAISLKPGAWTKEMIELFGLGKRRPLGNPTYANKETKAVTTSPTRKVIFKRAAPVKRVIRRLKKN